MVAGGGVGLSDGRGPIFLGVTWTWTAFAFCLFAVRAKSASRSLSGWPSFYGYRWDFVWVTVALLTALAAEVFMTVSVINGTGNHQALLSERQNINAAFWSWIGQVCAIFALVWGRFAVIAFLMGIQGRTYPRWRIALFTVGVAQFLINTVEVGLILNQCTPVRRLWDINVPGECRLIEVCSKVGYLQGSVGAFADFFLALYPPAVIIGPLQQMKLSIKIGLCLIMGGGVIAGIAGIVKTTSISSILATSDISFATMDLCIWVMTEVWFIIIFGSLPTVRSVLLASGRRVSRAFTAGSHDQASPKRSRVHLTDENWTDLSCSRNYENKVDVIGAAAVDRTRHDSIKAWDQSSDDEEKLTPASPQGREIIVTRETTVARHERR